jgi:hypothetical protein
MVDIQSINASSQPSRCEREGEGEATSRHREGRSYRVNGHTVTTVVAAKDRRCHGGLCEPRCARSRCSGQSRCITEIWDYIKDNILPDEHVSAERIVHVAKRYNLVEGGLYHRGANDVLMRCITREDGCELLAEIHGDECGNHASSHTLVGSLSA